MTSENVLARVFAICFGTEFELFVVGRMIQKQLASRRVTSESALARVSAICFGTEFEFVVVGGIDSKMAGQQASDIRECFGSGFCHVFRR